MDRDKQIEQAFLTWLDGKDIDPEGFLGTDDAQIDGQPVTAGCGASSYPDAGRTPPLGTKKAPGLPGRSGSPGAFECKAEQLRTGRSPQAWLRECWACIPPMQATS